MLQCLMLVAQFYTSGHKDGRISRKAAKTQRFKDLGRAKGADSRQCRFLFSNLTALFYLRRNLKDRNFKQDLKDEKGNLRYLC
jgi:hypothetical protein